MRDALNGFVIRGIRSNIPFQAALMQHPRFQAGNFNTGFLAEEYPNGFDPSMVPGHIDHGLPGEGGTGSLPKRPGPPIG